LRRSKVLVVIPARYGSTRFPGKPLAPIGGVPMIVRVRRRAARLRGADTVVVATDDRRIFDVVTADGGEAMMTSRRHRTGTDRVCEVAERFRHGIVVNVQGDEPFLPVAGVERLMEALQRDPSIAMATLAASSTDQRDRARPDVVKVVCDLDGNALYFSRAPVPASGGRFLRHVGIYGFRRRFLLGYRSLRRGPLEKRENLEQLRALENGYAIRVLPCRTAGIGVDTPADIKRVEKKIQSG
jgi:3-deoxy-manno-octulosonate cytidylyltransferase (CMP-KDO synthetase)